MKNRSENNISFGEACEILKKSKRTVGRYIKNSWLHPEKIKSKRGTLEYIFSREDLLKFKKPGRTEKTRPENNIISLLTSQIKVKDEQIKELLERDRETNVMLNQLQNRLLLTGDRKDREVIENKKSQKKNGWLKRLFKRN